MLHIVHVIRDLDIDSGGPSRSVPALACSQARLKGVRVSLLYQDRGNPVVSLPDDGVFCRPISAGDLLLLPNSIPGVIPWQTLQEKACIFHLHGLWSPTLHLAARFAGRHGLPYVVSTRGMLAGWCLNHKPSKKKLGWLLYQKKDLQRAACLLATSDAELQDVKALLPHQRVAVVPNGCAERPAETSVTPNLQTGQTGFIALALGRLHPVKGFAELIEAWASLRPAGWQLVIAGPDEDGYSRRLEELILEHDLSGHVRLIGAVGNGQKWAWLDRCDLFVAPSKTENFGMAVAEAMTAGKAVITTTGTPWACLPEIGAGWWVELSPDSLRDTLRTAMALSGAERRAMGQRARVYAQRYSPDKIAQETAALYQWLINGGVKPACVKYGTGSGG